MTSFHKPVANIIPGMMSIALVGKSAKIADDSLKGKGKKGEDRKSTRLNSSHIPLSRMPSFA